MCECELDSKTCQTRGVSFELGYSTPPALSCNIMSELSLSLDIVSFFVLVKILFHFNGMKSS